MIVFGRMSQATAKLAACPECGQVHGEDSLRCPTTDVMLPLEGRRLDGKFRFLSTLGAGGMASVYLAINERVDREVAIKFLRPEVGRDPESVARFRSEAKAAGRIGNRHICEILDLGDSPIGPYIVMERLRGVDLAALIRRQVRLAPGYAVRVVRHALEGLAAAHAAGIVHRDLKPGNIFLHRTDSGDTIVKLMDFGVSKFLDGTGEAQTASGILLGTPEYMAPEQLEGAHKIGPAADIWAMGAILYRAITGHQVFSGPSLGAVIKSMALDEVRPMSELVEGVPPELEQVIHRCLERSVPDRYQTPEQLSEALAPFEDLEVEVIPIIDPAPARSVEMSSIPVVDVGPAAPESTIEFDLDPDSQSLPVGPPVVAATAAAAAPPSRARRRLMLFALVFVIVFAVTAAVTQWPGLAERIGGSAQIAEPDPQQESETGSVSRDLPSSDETGEVAIAEAEADAEPDVSETDEAEAETGGQEAGPGQPMGTERPAPAGTFRAGLYISPNEPGPTTDLAGAKQHCATLADRRFGGEDGWHLANPAELSKFNGSRELKRGRYWTTALHDGRAAVYSMPASKKSSEKADRKIARPLCVTKY
jgi:serine/threonine protein kinase